jgi:hypothetical protein
MAETSRAMNDSKTATLTDCQRQIEAAVTELRRALERAAQCPGSTEADRETTEADLCLASRSAYFDFYTWLVLHDVVDEPAERDLDELFRRTLELMKSGRFRKSVQARFNDFRKECEHVRSGSSNFDLSSELASSVEAEG